MYCGTQTLSNFLKVAGVAQSTGSLGVVRSLVEKFLETSWFSANLLHLRKISKFSSDNKAVEKLEHKRKCAGCIL